MATHRRHSIEFKRQVVLEYLDGGTSHGLAKRHDIARNLIRLWLQKHEAGALDDESQAADLIQAYEARIAALERLVGQQAFELEFLKAFVYEASSHAMRDPSFRRTRSTHPALAGTSIDAKRKPDAQTAYDRSPCG